MANDRTRPHLWPLDIVRLLTFAAVISVHVLAFTELPANTTAAGAMMLLQFGREVFFTLSGFVLVYSTLGREVEPGRFWRRRVPAVAVPYLAWTVIYTVVTCETAPYPAFSWGTFATNVISGGAYYHLYFLVVTVQLYLVFPLLVQFVRRTAHHAAWVLAAVVAANLAWLAVVQYVPAPGGTGSWFWVHAYELLPSYAMYVLAGCYGALHLDKVEGLLARHPRRLLAGAGAGVAVALGVYAAQLPSMAPRVADSVLQPAMTASCVAALIVVTLVGYRWAEGKMKSAAAITVGSEISFCVYLCHPLILTILLNSGLGNGRQVVPAPVASLFAYMGTIAGAVGLSLILRRTPLAMLLTGRPWRRKDRGHLPLAAPRPAISEHFHRVGAMNLGRSESFQEMLSKQ